MEKNKAGAGSGRMLAQSWDGWGYNGVIATGNGIFFGVIKMLQFDPGNEHTTL